MSSTSTSSSTTESKSSSSSSTLTLQVKTLKGANFAIAVPIHYTVAELQTQIATERDVPVEQQRIIYKGKVLKSDQTLASYGLEDGDNLHLIIRTPQQTQAAQAAIAAEQNAMSDAPPSNGDANTTAPTGAAQIQIFPAGDNGMMIGQVDIHDNGGGMPDLNAIVNQVLNQMGVPGLAGAQQGDGTHPQPHITFSTNMPTVAFGTPGMDMQMMGPGGVMMGVPTSTSTSSTISSTSGSTTSSTTSTSGTTPMNVLGGAPLHPSASFPGFAGLTHGGSASLNDIRTNLNLLADIVTPPQHSVISPLGRGIITDPLSEASPASVATIFEQLHTVLANLQPRVADVAMQLRRHETLTGAMRQQVSQEANDVGMLLRRLSPFLHHVGRYGSGLQLGTDTAHASVTQAQPQVSVHVTTQPVITAVPVIPGRGYGPPVMIPNPTMMQNNATSSVTPTTTTTTTTVTTTPATAAPASASASATPAATNATTPSTPNMTGTAPQPQINMQQIMSQVGPMVGPIVSQLLSGAASAASSASTSGTPNPLAAIMQAVGPAVQQVAQGIQQGGANNPLMNIIQNVMGSLQGQQPQQQPTEGSAPVATTHTSTPSPTLTPAFTGSVTTTSTTPATTSTPSTSTPSTSTPSSTTSTDTTTPTRPSMDPNAFAQLMSGMMGVLGQQANATTTSTSSTTSQSSSSIATPAPVATPVAVAAPIATPIQSTPAANPLAGLMGMMGGAGAGAGGLMGMMSQIMGGAQGGRTIGDIMQSMGAGPSQDEDEDMEESSSRSPMESLMNRVIAGLSMPDMMALVAGNWAPLERQHGTLREILLHDMMDDTDTPHARDSLAITLAMGLVNSLLDDAVLAPVRIKMISNKDLSAASYPLVRQRCRELINIVIDTPITPADQQSQGATPFANQIKAWATILVGSWVNVLAEGFTDGVTSVDQIIKNALQLKLSSIGPELGFMLPMVSGILSSFVLRAHQSYRADLISRDDGRGAQGWIQHVPEGEQKHWIQTIAMDEKIQSEQKERMVQEAQALGVSTMSIQHPFSYTYASGSMGAAKKRKLAGSQLREGEPNDEKESTTSSSSSSTPYSTSDLAGADLGSGLSRALKQAIDTVHTQMVKEEKWTPDQIEEYKQQQQQTSQEVLSSLPSSNIQQLYRSQLVNDIRKRVRTDSDYDANKFPKTHQHIEKQ